MTTITINKSPTKETFHCECLTPSHHLFVSHDLVEDEIIIELKLNHYLPWWKRALVAIKYILGLDATDTTQYEDVILSHPDRAKLAKMLVRPIPPPPPTPPKKDIKNVRAARKSAVPTIPA